MSEIEVFVKTFNVLIEQSADAVFVLDNEGVCSYANQSAKKMIGSSEIESVSAYFNDSMFPSNNYLKQVNEYSGSRGKIWYYKKFINPADKKLTCCAGFLPLLNEEKEQYGWAVMLKSKTAAGQGYINSSQVNALVLCLNNLNKDACIVQNFANGEIVFVSDSFRNISGWSKDEIIKGGGLFYFMLMNAVNNDYVSGITDLLLNKNKQQIEKTVHSPLKHTTSFRKKNTSHVKIEITTSLVSLSDQPGVYYGISFINECKEIAGYRIRRNMPLTNREGEIVSLLAKGYSSKMIADTHTLKEGYVSQIRKRLLKKFNVNNSPELVQLLNAEGYL